MPHIVIDEKIDLFDFAKSFIPEFQKSPIIKITTIYVEKNGLNALFPTIVIDEEHQEFFIQLSTTKSKTTIRLLPLTDPIKTDGVKYAMTKIYFQIKKWKPDVSISKTNLADYLEKDVVS